MHKNARADEESNTANEFIANLERSYTGNYITLSVRPGAKSYAVTIPATSHHRVYQTKAR